MCELGLELCKLIYSDNGIDFSVDFSNPYNLLKLIEIDVEVEGHVILTYHNEGIRTQVLKSIIRKIELFPKAKRFYRKEFLKVEWE